MDAMRSVLFLTVCLTLCRGQRSPDDKLADVPDDPYQLGPAPRDLVEAWQQLLQEADSRGLSVEKKASVIPRCDVGERCAMKHGPRIGRLCDCLRGTACNTFFLRCS